jgi:hypothetical protein
MDLSKWFHDQLQSSLQGFIWAIEQMPAGRRYKRPPYLLGEWSAARHAFHLMHYERTFALPSMKQWLGEPIPEILGPSEDIVWMRDFARGDQAALDGLLAQFREVRGAQVELLPEFDGNIWEKPLVTHWGTKPLRWVVTKTYQHTAEHIHDVLSMALFWDMAR